MKLKINFIVAIMVICFWVTPAYAYLDTGTGSILLQGLLAGIAGLVTIITFYWGKVKIFFSKISRSKDSPEDSM